MEKINQLSKKLLQLSLGELSIDPQYVFHAKQGEENTRALELSLKEDGYQGAMTTINKDGNHIIINGNRCYPILLDLYGPDFKVYVWVLDGEPSDEEIKLYILALGKVRTKLKQDIMNEFDYWNSVTPSNQGKKDGSVSRNQIIAQRIGISTSLLNKLLAIRKEDVDLMRQIDAGDASLKNAEDRANKLKKERENAEKEAPASDSHDGVVKLDDTGNDNSKYRDKNVDLGIFPMCCPTCNRSFITITPEEIPSIFNVNRKEENKQITWMRKSA